MITLIMHYALFLKKKSSIIDLYFNVEMDALLLDNENCVLQLLKYMKSSDAKVPFEIFF